MKNKPSYEFLGIQQERLKILHTWLPIGFILWVFLSKMYESIDWAKFMKEITTEIPPIEFFVVIIAILALILGPLIRYRFKIYLRKVGSVEIANPSIFDFDNCKTDEKKFKEEFKIDEKFNSRFINNKNQSETQLNNAELRQQYNDRIEHLTDLAEEAFPRGKGKNRFSYANSRNERRDAFRLWTDFNPDTAQIIYYDKKPIGMSLMLRLSKDAYSRYKGKLKSWEIEKRDLVETDQKDTPYLFFQYIYCKKDENIFFFNKKYRNEDASKYMCWVFLKHLSIFRERSEHEPILIAPRKSEMGKVNAGILGFKYCGIYNNFDHYELDLRDPDELNKEGQEVYRVLQQLSQ